MGVSRSWRFVLQCDGNRVQGVRRHPGRLPALLHGDYAFRSRRGRADLQRQRVLGGAAARVPSLLPGQPRGHDKRALYSITAAAEAGGDRLRAVGGWRSQPDQDRPRRATIHRRRTMRRQPPVLCYHRIGGPLELGVTRVGRSLFTRQMTALAQAGWKTLTLEQYAACRRADVPTWKVFLLTFDDGYASLGQHAYPILARLGAEAGRAIAYPFGAVDTRVLRHARNAGYELGFAGVKGSGEALCWSRVPVYFWDRGDVPFGLRTDALGSVGRFVAHVANRCAVGTSMMQVIGRRSSAVSTLTTDNR